MSLGRRPTKQIPCKREIVLSTFVESTIFEKLSSRKFGFYFLPPPKGSPEQPYIPGLRCESDLSKILLLSYQAEKKETLYAGAPRGHVRESDAVEGQVRAT